MFVITIAIYVLLVLFVVIGFLSYQSNVNPLNEFKKVCIIIPARNEEGKLGNCLRSIIDQDYPKQRMEIIVVDDASTDRSFNEATEVLSGSDLEHKIIRNKEHLGKKQSIKLAIDQCNSEFIITRDADTISASKNWLRTIMNYMISSKKEFVICPLAISSQNTILSSLQEIEMAVLMLFTISSTKFKLPFLCNGANLAFTKNLFYTTGAYNDHMHIASGDDIFFLENVKRMDRATIGFLKDKEALVYTFPEKDLLSMVNQKVRWSAKIFKNFSVINWLSAAIITLANCVWIGAVFYLLFKGQNWPLSLFFVLSKLLIDILLVFLASSFVKVKTGAVKVTIIGVIYPFYASFIAVLSVFIKPKWKSN